MKVTELYSALGGPDPLSLSRWYNRTPGVPKSGTGVAATATFLSGAVAKRIGGITPIQAVGTLFNSTGAGRGWYGPMMPPRAVVKAVTLNGIVAAVAGGAVYKGGARVGAAYYGFGQAIAGNCQ